MTRLREFNELPPDLAAETVRPCLDVPRWVEGILDQRPYADTEALLSTAQSVADPFTPAEVAGALAHHPRIGERAQGRSAEAEASRGEQLGLNLDDDVQRRLVEGNEAYERRFGRVFLIRAAGRSSEEILEALETRLANDPDTEEAIVADQLRQIAVLRLAQAVPA